MNTEGWVVAGHARKETKERWMHRVKCVPCEVYTFQFSLFKAFQVIIITFIVFRLHVAFFLVVVSWERGLPDKPAWEHSMFSS